MKDTNLDFVNLFIDEVFCYYAIFTFAFFTCTLVYGIVKHYKDLVSDNDLFLQIEELGRNPLDEEAEGEGECDECDEDFEIDEDPLIIEDELDKDEKDELIGEPYISYKGNELNGALFQIKKP
jgi:hypothetical protein